MRPRLHVAFLLITLPVTFLPLLLWAGWKLAGRDTLREVPAAARWAFLGKKPKGYAG